MAHYPKPPGFCPMCGCEEILGKTWTSSLQQWVSYSCPRCMWRDAGLAPHQTNVTVALAPAYTRGGLRAQELYSQPQARTEAPVDRIPLPPEEIWPSFP